MIVQTLMLDAVAEIEHLRAELQHEREHNKRLLAQLENWDLIEMNREINQLRAALEQLIRDYEDETGEKAMAARAALNEETKK